MYTGWSPYPILLAQKSQHTRLLLVQRIVRSLHRRRHILEGPPEGHDEQAVSALCDWVSPQARARCTVREVVREGTPPERIVAEAKASRADLIVLGARPRSYLGGLVFGSTTEEVIRTAPCPVLSIIQRPSRAAAK